MKINFQKNNKDYNFMTTFIYTYQSFTTPWILLEKLQQRYPFVNIF